MPRRLRFVWVMVKAPPLFGLNIAGYGSGREGLAAEIDAAEAILCHPFGDRVRMNLNMALTDRLPEIIAFFNHRPGDKTDPIFKMAIIGAPGWKKTWYGLTKKIQWPKNARFFDEHEKAKAG